MGALKEALKYSNELSDKYAEIINEAKQHINFHKSAFNELSEKVGGIKLRSKNDN